MKINPLQNLLLAALQEDIGEGDHTTLACIDEEAGGVAELIMKEPGILAGLEVIRVLYQLFDPALAFSPGVPDGTWCDPGFRPFRITGKKRSILQTERLALNILQRMSAIATHTAQFVEQVMGTGCRILDTRKTTPNFRLLEKEAVRLGGGENHRMGLYDMVMIKDNHIDFAGGIHEAVEKTRSYLNSRNLILKIEVEARSLDEVAKILQTGGVDRILLDNMTPEMVRVCVNQINGQAETEASGGITLGNVRQYALAGVDFISIGALTHQVKSIDMSLKVIDVHGTA